MKQRALTAAVILACAAVAAVLALGEFRDGEPDQAAVGAAAAPEGRRGLDPGASGGRAGADGQPGDRAEPGPSGRLPSLAREPRSGPHFEILELRKGAQVALHASPGGRPITSLSPRSEFGSPRVLAVARQKGPWLGVITPRLANGEIGWVRHDPAKLERYWTRYSLSVSLSKLEMKLRYGRRELGRYTVSIGATGTDTPQGRFAITDALLYRDSPYYGCCALALSGHQERLPVGWLGGDRIAIHGTPGPVGYAASNGCIRATNETMRTLFRRIPLGTPVFVRG